MELDEGDPSPPPPEDPLRLSDEHPEIVAAVAAQPQLPHPLPTHDTTQLILTEGQTPAALESGPRPQPARPVASTAAQDSSGDPSDADGLFITRIPGVLFRAPSPQSQPPPSTVESASATRLKEEATPAGKARCTSADASSSKTPALKLPPHMRGVGQHVTGLESLGKWSQSPTPSLSRASDSDGEDDTEQQVRVLEAVHAGRNPAYELPSDGGCIAYLLGEGHEEKVVIELVVQLASEPEARDVFRVVGERNRARRETPSYTAFQQTALPKVRPVRQAPPAVTANLAPQSTQAAQAAQDLQHLNASTTSTVRQAGAASAAALTAENAVSVLLAMGIPRFAVDLITRVLHEAESCYWPLTELVDVMATSVRSRPFLNWGEVGTLATRAIREGQSPLFAWATATQASHEKLMREPAPKAGAMQSCQAQTPCPNSSFGQPPSGVPGGFTPGVGHATPNTGASGGSLMTQLMSGAQSLSPEQCAQLACFVNAVSAPGGSTSPKVGSVDGPGEEPVDRVLEELQLHVVPVWYGCAVFGQSAEHASGYSNVQAPMEYKKIVPTIPTSKSALKSMPSGPERFTPFLIVEIHSPAFPLSRGTFHQEVLRQGLKHLAMFYADSTVTNETRRAGAALSAWTLVLEDLLAALTAVPAFSKQLGQMSVLRARVNTDGPEKVILSALQLIDRILLSPNQDEARTLWDNVKWTDSSLSAAGFFELLHTLAGQVGEGDEELRRKYKAVIRSMSNEDTSGDGLISSIDDWITDHTAVMKDNPLMTIAAMVKFKLMRRPLGTGAPGDIGLAGRKARHAGPDAKSNAASDATNQESAMVMLLQTQLREAEARHSAESCVAQTQVQTMMRSLQINPGLGATALSGIGLPQADQPKRDASKMTQPCRDALSQLGFPNIHPAEIALSKQGRPEGSKAAPGFMRIQAVQAAPTCPAKLRAVAFNPIGSSARSDGKRGLDCAGCVALRSFPMLKEHDEKSYRAEHVGADGKSIGPFDRGHRMDSGVIIVHWESRCPEVWRAVFRHVFVDKNYDDVWMLAFDTTQ